MPAKIKAIKAKDFARRVELDAHIKELLEDGEDKTVLVIKGEAKDLIPLGLSKSITVMGVRVERLPFKLPKTEPGVSAKIKIKK